MALILAGGLLITACEGGSIASDDGGESEESDDNDDSNDSSDTNVTGIDTTLIGNWLQYYSSSFSTFMSDGIYLEADGDVYDLDGSYSSSIWNYYIDWNDYEAKFTILKNGIVTGYDYEDSNGDPFTGTYILGSLGEDTTITVYIMSSAGSETRYYLQDK